MTESKVQEIDDLVDSVGNVRDPEERLRIIRSRAPEVQRISEGLRRVQASSILELRELGRTWNEIAEILGVSRQRAEQLSRP